MGIMIKYFIKNFVCLFIIHRFASCNCLPIRNRWAFLLYMQQGSLHFALQGKHSTAVDATEVNGGGALAAVAQGRSDDVCASIVLVAGHRGKGVAQGVAGNGGADATTGRELGQTSVVAGQGVVALALGLHGVCTLDPSKMIRAFSRCVALPNLMGFFC